MIHDKLGIDCKGGGKMKRQLSKPLSKRTETLNQVRIMDTRGSESETCSQPGSKYQGCQNPRGCGCTAC